MLRTLPTLTTDRLLLSPLTLADATLVKKYAGDARIAAATGKVPHPYPDDGTAEKWIARHQLDFFEEKTLILAIRLRAAPGELIGTTGLKLSFDDKRGELGYWIGAPFWGKGYCTESAQRIVRYAFEDLALNKVLARHFGNNPASGRVMQKLGMQKEGHLREHIVKNDVLLDLVEYGILGSDHAKNPAM